MSRTVVEVLASHAEHLERPCLCLPVRRQNTGIVNRAGLYYLPAACMSPSASEQARTADFSTTNSPGSPNVAERKKAK